MSSDGTRWQVAQDCNRKILRDLVECVRHHLDVHHPGEDIDCSGHVRPAVDDGDPEKVRHLLEMALCALARKSRDADADVLDALDFAPDPEVSTPDQETEQKGRASES